MKHIVSPMMCQMVSFYSMDIVDVSKDIALSGRASVRAYVGRKLFFLPETPTT